MRCNICDKALSDKEISYNDDIGTFDPCSTCLDVIMDTAYSDGFVHSDEIETVVDPGFDWSFNEASDISSFNTWWSEDNEV